MSPRTKLRDFLLLLGEALGLVASAYLVWLCLRALITAEIKFGRGKSVINLYTDPGWFWGAFWMQIALGGAGAGPVLARHAQASARAPAGPCRERGGRRFMKRFSVVETHTTPWEAHVGRALLESEGIPAFLGSEHIVGAWWPMSMVFGGVRLLVRHEDLAQARSVLALRDQGELEAALAQEFPPDMLRCDRCGSEQFSERRSWLAISLAFMLLFISRATFRPAKDLLCDSCGEPG